MDSRSYIFRFLLGELCLWGLYTALRTIVNPEGPTVNILTSGQKLRSWSQLEKEPYTRSIV